MVSYHFRDKRMRLTITQTSFTIQCQAFSTLVLSFSIEVGSLLCSVEFLHGFVVKINVLPLAEVLLSQGVCFSTKIKQR